MSPRVPEAEPTRIKLLLDRLLAVRARRDAQPRWSERWRALDDELHVIERAVFRAPIDDDVADARRDRTTRLDRAG